jgi:uncharacterized membrane-anchored protein YhcB (DUF1043 family)
MPLGASDFSFTEQLLLNLAGPLLTVVVGTLVIGLFASRITRKAQERREDEMRKAQERREDEMRNAEERREHHALRERLITDVTQAPTALYLATQHYSRAKLDKLPAEQLKPFRDALDAQYLESRRTGIVLEHLLELHFPESTSRLLMHRVMDLLTIRYFQLVRDGGPSALLLDANKGDEHTGLTEEELKLPRKVLKTYHETLSSLITAVAEGELALPRAPSEQ